MSSVKKPYKNMGQFHKHKNGKLWCANRSYFAWLCKMLIWRRSIPSGNFCQINFFSFSGCQRFSIKLFFGFVDFENFFCAIFWFCWFSTSNLHPNKERLITDKASAYIAKEPRFKTQWRMWIFLCICVFWRLLFGDFFRTNLSIFREL